MFASPQVPESLASASSRFTFAPETGGAIPAALSSPTPSLRFTSKSVWVVSPSAAGTLFNPAIDKIAVPATWNPAGTGKPAGTAGQQCAGNRQGLPGNKVPRQSLAFFGPEESFLGNSFLPALAPRRLRRPNRGEGDEWWSQCRLLLRKSSVLTVHHLDGGSGHPAVCRLAASAESAMFNRQPKAHSRTHCMAMPSGSSPLPGRSDVRPG